MTDPRLVDPAAIHLALGIPPSTLRRWAAEGRLAHRYDLEEVAELAGLIRMVQRANRGKVTK